MLKRRLFAAVVALALFAVPATFAVSTTSCASAPLASPAANLAMKKLQVVHALDAIRDLAIDANKQQPPLVDVETTRQIVTFHQSALLVIQASESGWQAALGALVDEAAKNLPDKDKAKFGPYFTLASTLVKGLTR